MPEGAFQERMEQCRAVVELTASSNTRGAHATPAAARAQEPTASGTVTSLLDRLFDGSLGHSGMAA
jgi:hypothetical protein